MAFDAPSHEVLRYAAAALDAAGVPYMLTGSLASSLHGVPRTTQDLDFVIAPDERTLEALLLHFPADRFYVSRHTAFEALRKSSLFNVVDTESGWKLDFIIRKSREFSRVEFDRRVRVELFGATIAVATPEDVLISKLEWAKRSGSERQLEDAVGVLRTNKAKVDLPYIERWVGTLDLAPQWKAVVARIDP